MPQRSSLFIRIVEGKNLPAKDITGSSDPYCIVKIDNEVIIRTATVWKTLFPFWGEEYEVHLSPNFHCVSFYVMDEDALSRDDVIGKVCLSQSLLMESPKGYSGWLSLTEIDLDEEVQGELHLQIEITGSGAARKLRCTVFDARDLARKDRNGASDPFVRVRYNGKTHETSVSPGFGKTSGWGGHLGRGDCYRERRVSDPQPGFTAVFRIGFREAGIALAGFSLQVIKKSCYPRWNETFEFELDESATEKLCVVEVWDWDLVSRNDFLGKVVFNVQGLETVQREEGWFLLRPEKSKPRVDEGSLGSLHLQVQLRDEMVLPSIHYQPLVQLLCQEVRAGVKDKRVHLMTLIDETTAAECRQEVAVNLVKLFLGHGLATEFLDLLFELELDKTDEPNTLFRSNSLASKSMESFLKVAGMQYLHQVLGPTLRRVFEEKRYVELDPSKVESREVGCSSLHRIQSESDVIQQSAQLLQSYLADLLAAIAGSVKACPVVIRATFQRLFKRVGERFPEEKDQSLKFIAVTSFLCLRFFSPAIMSPKLFHLREKHADARASRALLLLAKAVQNVGNLGTSVTGTKEAWMAPLQPAIQQGVAQMKQLILQLVDIEEKEESDLQEALSLQSQVVKEGPLFIYKNKGKGPLLSPSFKKLHFSLTSDALTYAKTPNSKKIAFITPANIRAAEKVEEKSFGNAHVMQIIHTNENGQPDTAYLQCKCVNELNQWLSALRKVCVNNTHMLCSYHPGIFRGDKWSCCHQKDRADRGCGKTRHGVMLREWNDPLDPNLEAQLIFRHLLGMRQQMREKYLELSTLEKEAKLDLSRSEDPESVDGPSRLFQVLQDLEEIHRKELSRLSDLASQDRNHLVELQT
ncbi:ras GTPase-activating protein 4B isoform X2 [Varanus komodoensis]|uniref:ras GTPase-activating protein 4B isoform X2 n=1 Tax=Varanus komodoensis TaxID=61221 RepID=UPI001CF780BA|nr:ras GTPase-activating protein 4B isoform X2 [Varanus komodoensis]